MKLEDLMDHIRGSLDERRTYKTAYADINVTGRVRAVLKEYQRKAELVMMAMDKMGHPSPEQLKVMQEFLLWAQRGDKAFVQEVTKLKNKLRG